MEQRVRFCKTPNAERMAYAVTGEGPPLVIAPGWISNLQVHWDSEAPRRFWERLSKNHTLIRYDKPGTGLSDRDVANLGPEGRIADLEALVEHLRLDCFNLLGWSEGGPLAISYAARHPERIERLVLYGSFAKWWIPSAVLEPMIQIIRSQWGAGSAAMSALFVPSNDPHQVAYFTELQRSSASPNTAAEMLATNTQIDVQLEASTVTCPVLVLHRELDAVIPVDEGRKLAALMPNSDFVLLQGQDHLPWWGDRDALLRHIEAFLGTPAEKSGQKAGSTGTFRTILFTDLVGHTEMMRRLGDERGRAVLREHETITREVLKEHGGAEIKTMGDGFLASFPSVTRAVECALALQQAVADRNAGAPTVGAQQPPPDTPPADEIPAAAAPGPAGAPLHPEPSTLYPLAVRVGINAGEPIEEDGDLFGETVILAARIAAMANGGDILASLAVRELCAGKGFLFADLGEHAMRGFEDPVRVFEIKRPA